MIRSCCCRVVYYASARERDFLFLAENRGLFLFGRVVLCSAKLFLERIMELRELVGQSLYQSYEDGACAPTLVMWFWAQFSINKTRPALNLFLFF